MGYSKAKEWTPTPTASLYPIRHNLPYALGRRGVGGKNLVLRLSKLNTFDLSLVIDYLRGDVKKKPSIFADIIQIAGDPPPSYHIFDKFNFDKVLTMLTSLPPLEFLTKIMKF